LIIFLFIWYCRPIFVKPLGHFAKYPFLSSYQSEPTREFFQLAESKNKTSIGKSFFIRASKGNASLLSEKAIKCKIRAATKQGGLLRVKSL
jgi:hypothetical protein